MFEQQGGNRARRPYPTPDQGGKFPFMPGPEQSGRFPFTSEPDEGWRSPVK